MNLRIIFLILIFIPLNFAMADTEITEGATSYVVPDASTSGVAAPTLTTTASAGTVVSPTTTNDGYVTYNIVASKPPCTNTTCITAQSISNAKHAYVSDSDVKTYVNLLKTPDTDLPDCAPPTQAGARVYRSVYRDGNVTSKEYNDSFCMNQGCTYFGIEGAERCE